jgi:hypothetical protein
MLVCLQETKISDVCNSLVAQILGTMFDYDYLPSVNVAGGVFCWDGIVVTGRCPMYPDVVFLCLLKPRTLKDRRTGGG